MDLKRILLAALVLLAGAGWAQAQQRTCDMEVTLLSPAASAVIAPYASFTVSVSIRNNGPDDLNADDTVYYWTRSIPVFNTIPLKLQQPIPAGSSATLTLATYVNDNGAGNEENYCVRVLSNPANTGLFIDTTNDDNNTDCNLVTLQSVNPTAIAGLAGAEGGLKVYPNPATAEIVIDLKGNKDAGLSLVIRDMTGRKAAAFPAGTLKPAAGGLRVNVSALPPGVYLLELSDGKSRAVGRFARR